MINVNTLITFYKMHHFDDFNKHVKEHLNDRASVTKLLKNNCIRFFDISDELKNDKDMALLFLNKDSSIFKFLNPDFQKEEEFILAGIKGRYACISDVLNVAPDSIKNKPEIAEYCLKKHIHALEFLPFYADNKNLLLKLNVTALQFMSERLRDDYDVALNSVFQLGRYLEYVSPRLQDHYELVLTAVKNEGDALQFASDRLKNDKTIVKAAIKNSWNSFSFSSEQLKDDKEIVLYAIKKDFTNLQYASTAMQQHFMNSNINW